MVGKPVCFREVDEREAVAENYLLAFTARNDFFYFRIKREKLGFICFEIAFVCVCVFGVNFAKSVFNCFACKQGVARV